MASSRSSGATAAVIVVAHVIVIVAVLAGWTGDAAAHATLTGAEPTNGGTVGAVPPRIELQVTGKAATGEGDPVRVYDPTGRRIDTGEAHVPEAGDVIHAYLDPAATEEGEYQILYEIVSADTHVISGRLSFTVQQGAAAHGDSRSLSFRLPAAGAAPTPPSSPVLAICAGLALLPVLSRRRRRT